VTGKAVIPQRLPDGRAAVLVFDPCI